MRREEILQRRLAMELAGYEDVKEMDVIFERCIPNEDSTVFVVEDAADPDVFYLTVAGRNTEILLGNKKRVQDLRTGDHLVMMYQSVYDKTSPAQLSGLLGVYPDEDEPFTLPLCKEKVCEKCASCRRWNEEPEQSWFDLAHNVVYIHPSKKVCEHLNLYIDREEWFLDKVYTLLNKEPSSKDPFINASIIMDCKTYLEGIIGDKPSRLKDIVYLTDLVRKHDLAPALEAKIAQCEKLSDDWLARREEERARSRRTTLYLPESTIDYVKKMIHMLIVDAKEQMETSLKPVSKTVVFPDGYRAKWEMIVPTFDLDMPYLRVSLLDKKGKKIADFEGDALSVVTRWEIPASKSPTGHAFLLFVRDERHKDLYEDTGERKKPEPRPSADDSAKTAAKPKEAASTAPAKKQEAKKSRGLRGLFGKKK